jgi:ABC-2 type transport system ATP-binding protein
VNVIETRQLTKRFGRVTAVHNLNLSIPQGAVYGFIGPNGAGKTTTLRLLAGLLSPSAGTIHIAGHKVDGSSRQIRRMIGYMPDFFGLYPDLTVWEYLDFFARCYGVPPRQSQGVIEELLELVDLTGKREAFVQTLSRGMQQRLCLAHTLVHDPQILLLDEPASGLDPQARVEIRELLRELGRMGKTIMVSSHILSELAEICDHVGIIEKGHLLANGPIAEIRRQVLAGCTVRVRVLDRHDDLLAYLQQKPDIFDPQVTPEGIEMSFQGDNEALAALLRELIGVGFAVHSFSEESRDLEDLFFRITKGEVS